MTQKITFDPPPLPIDDHARSGVWVVRCLKPYDRPTICFRSRGMWHCGHDTGYKREDEFHPGYWPLPKITVEEEK